MSGPMNRQQRRALGRQAPPGGRGGGGSGGGGPGEADARFAAALRLHQDGRLDEAEAQYRQILRSWPGHAGAWQLWGVVAHQRGDPATAVERIGRAVTLAPDYAEARLNLGAALQALGRLAEAEAAFRAAAGLRPDYAQAHFNLGAALRAQERVEDAAASFRRAVELRPDHVEAHNNLGAALHLLDRLDAAEAHLRRALELRPDHPQALANLGNTLEAQGRLEASAGCLRRALRLRPDHADGHYSLANTLWREGDRAGAEAAFRQALALDPGLDAADFNLGLLRLGRGALAEGWARYGRRLAAPKIQASRRPAARAWRGEDLDGTRLLVWREQGLGDELMFAACYPDLIARAGHVVIECDPRLVPLFARSFPQATVRPETVDAQGRETMVPLDADVHVAAGDLPGRLRPDLAAFPAAPGYLVADPERVARWRERLAGLGEGITVGICWRSGLTGARRIGSYTGLESWGPVLAVPGLIFVSLQYDHNEDEIARVERRFGLPVARWPDLDLRNDLENAAALTASLDLVITAATSVGELAGALGVPVWRFAGPGDWTVLGTPGRPWFPSMRLFYARPGQPLDRMLERIGRALPHSGRTLPRGVPVAI